MKRIYTLLLVFFSFLVGFTACDDGSNNEDDKDVYEEPDEDILYGCQYTTFSLNVTGDVKDKNGNPIKDIKLIYNYTLEATSKEVTAQSDENGDFVIADEDSNCWGENYKPSKLTIEDIDGELNGTFENKEITDMELNCYDNPESGWDKTRICEGVISVILDEKERSDEDFIDNDIVNDEDIVDSDEANNDLDEEDNDLDEDISDSDEEDQDY